MQGISASPNETTGTGDTGPRNAVLHAVAVPAIAAPLAAYSHAVEVQAGARLVFCSGQIAVGPGGAVPAGCAAQAELCFANIAEILGAAGLGLADVIRINAYVSGREHLGDYMRVRDRMFPAPHPASTLMIVSGFAREEFVVEIEVVAAGLAGGTAEQHL